LALVAVSAFAVESANTVGFQEKPLNVGYTDACSEFWPVGSLDGVDTIGRVVPNANFVSGEDTVEIYDEDGDSAYYLVYISAAFIARYHLSCEAGWYDFDDGDFETCLNDDVDISAGQGFTCYTETDDVAITIPTAYPL
jgi:hypothetical protein